MKDKRNSAVVWIVFVIVVVVVLAILYSYSRNRTVPTGTTPSPAVAPPSDETAAIEQELKSGVDIEGLDAELKDIDKELAGNEVGERMPPAAPEPVKIENFAFSPAELRIKVGTNVVWENKDGVGHTVTSDTNTFRESPLLAKGETYNLTFNQKGTFTYHCTPHPNMKARVIVE